jgi:hypothetical protein
MSAIGGGLNRVDATHYLEGEMECGLMGHKFHRGFTGCRSNAWRPTIIVAERAVQNTKARTFDFRITMNSSTWNFWQGIFELACELVYGYLVT